MSGYLLELEPENSVAKENGTHCDFLCTEIPRQPSGQLTYNDFYWQYMKRNVPIIFTGVSIDWECRKQWIDHNRTGQTQAINFDYLRQKIGNSHVPVANCSKEYFNSHQKCEILFLEYLDYWQTLCQNEINDEMLDNLAADNPTVKNSANPVDKLYLKDWHLKAYMPEYEFYKVPKYFASDWLNEYLIDTQQDDYRFVYMGPKGSWTPFHSDVFGSYSWSTNIIGLKKWLLLPPGEEFKLSDSLGNLPFRIDEDLLEKNDVRFSVIMQTENESIFVPSGWYHQVTNLTDTISVNHNWFNACSLLQIWNNLAKSMNQVIEQIEDCRQMDNFEEHCQTMLRADFGINFMDFLNILEHISAKRLRLCPNNNHTNPELESSTTALIVFDTFTMNDFHMRYDLICIHRVLCEMLQNFVICDSRNFLYRRCLALQELTKNF